MKKLLVVFLLFASFSLQSQELYHFSNISIEKGLSQITVVSIYQDKFGFMWFGTRNGLNKYNGYDFKIYRNKAGDETSISSNHIMCMTEDNNDNLWVGTDNGLNRLDISTNQFKQYLFDENGESSPHAILSLLFDSNGRLWAGTNSGLSLYDSTNDSFNKIDIRGLNGGHINAIAEKDGKLYIAADSKDIIIYDINKKQLDRINTASTSNYSYNIIREIYIDRKENVWIGTTGGGVKVLEKGSTQFKEYNKDNGLSNNYIRCISESPNGDIVVGTASGLNTIEAKTGGVRQFKNYPSNQGNLNHYSIFCTFYNQAQTLWVGTYAGGVNYYSPYTQKFHYYDPSSELKSVLGIMGAAIEMDGNLYIATEGGGLLKYNRKDNTFHNYRLTSKDDDSYSHNIIKSIYLDGDEILCGTNFGTIYSFNPKTNIFKLKYELNDVKPIYHLSRNSNGDLMVGNISSRGLVFINKNGDMKSMFPVKGKGELYIPNVRCVLEIEKGVYLIGTRKLGLYKYDSNNEELYQYKRDSQQMSEYSIPDNNVSSIVKDSAGNIWIGVTGGGLCLFDIKTAEFTTFDTNQGLLNNNVFEIVESNNNQLWISTIDGISNFDLKTKTFKNYNYKNDIRIQEFTPHASKLLSDNNIYFGGNNGFIIFNDKQFLTNPYVPAVVLNKLYVNNELVVPRGKDGIIDCELFEQKTITLNHNQTNIAIEYSALNFIFPEKNQYRYILEGFDHNWNEVGSRRVAYYTNIPPGKYKFIIQGSNNDGVWNLNGAELAIIVSPPFWKTKWAYALYVILAITVLTIVLRYFNEKRKLKNDIKLKQVESKAQELLHQERNRLFTNFSHELRTPLTLIINPIEDLMGSYNLDMNVQNKIHLIRNNAYRMLRIVNNLMDFQKKESGNMNLTLSKGNFILFAEEMVITFKELAISRNINLEFRHLEESIPYAFDKNLMEKVFFNFLSNAFKNVENGGTIIVRVDVKPLNFVKEMVSSKIETIHFTDNQYILLDIQDSGVGIAPEELDKIFNPFYQVAQNEHSKSGTGLGLSLSKSIIEMHKGVVWVESEQSVGSTFHCILPIAKDLANEGDAIVDEKVNNTISCEMELNHSEIVYEKNQRNKKYTILIVEDNKDLREYIVSHLAPDYNILEAANGKDAMTSAINFLPDLIITDWMMPKLDGKEMSAQLKNNLLTGHIPIIMITAKAMPENIKEGYEAGADEYITKPFDSSVLKVRVENIIQSREKLKEIYSKRFSLESLGVEVETTSMDDRFMQKMMEALKQNIANSNLNLNDFSKEIGVSHSNLYRKIKAITGLTPNEFIRNFRLETSSKLLKETELSISEIASEVGFSSIAYYSNCFKMVYDVSPTEYRNRK